MLSVQFNQVHPRAVQFFSDFILANFGPVKFGYSQNNKCDIQINGIRMSDNRILMKKIVNQFAKKKRQEGPPELMYQNGEIPPNEKASLNVWYTGENIRPPLYLNYDYFLSFDRDSFSGRNLYFPLWYLDIDWGFGEKFCRRIGVNVEGIELTKLRDFKKKKSKFACAFIGNAHPMRFEAIRKFSDIGQIDIYGKSVGKPVNSKFEIAKNYKYNLCFENDTYPGYVTEKLLDAYYCETVPLYWGDLGNQNLINNKSHLNLKEFQNLEAFREKIEFLNDAEYEVIYKQPFLNFMPSLNDLKDIFSSVL